MGNYSTNYDEIREGEGKKVEHKKTEKDNEINLKYDKQSADATQAYEKAIDDTKIAYEGEYQKNAVQKLINEQQIAEKNANLGLTSSGLNATQQTAVQLSYANQKGALDLAKRKDLEAKSSALEEALSTIRQNRSDELDANANYWSGVADSNAQAIYNTNVDANTEMYKAGLDADTELEKARIKAQSSGSSEEKAPQKIYWFRGKETNANTGTETGKYLYYNTETNKEESIPAYTNPYTSSDNRLEYSAEYNDPEIGFFQLASGVTGYQPRGLKSEGGRFTAALTDYGEPIRYDLHGNGKLNTVWKAPSGRYFIWNDTTNSYEDFTENFPQIEALYKK